MMLVGCVVVTWLASTHWAQKPLWVFLHYPPRWEWVGKTPSAMFSGAMVGGVQVSPSLRSEPQLPHLLNGNSHLDRPSPTRCRQSRVTGWAWALEDPHMKGGGSRDRAHNETGQVGGSVGDTWRACRYASPHPEVPTGISSQGWMCMKGGVRSTPWCVWQVKRNSCSLYVNI